MISRNAAVPLAVLALAVAALPARAESPFNSLEQAFQNAGSLTARFVEGYQARAAEQDAQLRGQAERVSGAVAFEEAKNARIEQMKAQLWQRMVADRTTGRIGVEYAKVAVDPELNCTITLTVERVEDGTDESEVLPETWGDWLHRSGSATPRTRHLRQMKDVSYAVTGNLAESTAQIAAEETKYTLESVEQVHKVPGVAAWTTVESEAKRPR
ncbi:MAG TPA: hypothetical protein VNI01_07190 [Elusimicrobiota bacterium]|jgi:hypothetical protein|nr:hypothetical protein [Elusimicrobiota bacterium]